MTAPPAGTARLAEERLVRLLARGTLSDENGAAARLLAGAGVDWACVLRLARHHEVVPLVCRNLERLELAGVPPDIGAALEADRRTAAARNALLARELTCVLRVLSDAGVPAIPMKGVALAETLHDDPALRDCSDMDVLVPRERARDALRVLRVGGYAAEFTERFFESLLLRTNIEYTLARRERNFEYVLDLHWGIGWTPRHDRRAMETLWAESRRVTRWGVEMHAMSAEWELLTLAVHAARHGWQRLKWLVDVHDYCAAQALDWQKVRQTAERFGWLTALRRTLDACQRLLGTPAPPALASVSPDERHPVSVAGVEADGENLLPLRVIDRSSERARYLLRVLLVPTLAERRLVRLPSGLGVLYYPLRPLRLTGKWGWHLLRGRVREAFR